jgi:hypothetical protein
VIWVLFLKRQASEGVTPGLRLAVLVQDRVDLSESLIDLVTVLRGRGSEKQNGGQVQASPFRCAHGPRRTLAPVRTILPETKMRSTTLGLTIR